MMMKNRMKNSAVLLRAGMVFLLLGIAWKWVVNPAGILSPRLADGVMGLLYGLAVGCLLAAILKRATTPAAR